MADQLARLQAALADRYAIEHELGRGGMATVYLAQDLKHRRLVAIKVLKPELAAALGPERFLREIETAARLNHPHILPLHDSGEADSFLYYVMPYVEGESLRERLTREGQLPLDDALRIAREVASALSHAHSHDVVHRDINPENILLSGGEAVVADFGIGRAITAAARYTLTGTGIAIGTPGYMSPEQATGGARLDGRSDIYSLACVLYEMLAGDPPYVASSAQAVAARQSMDPVPRLRSVRETVPAAVEQVIGQALSKVPADRFATAAAFAEALQAAMRTAASPAAARRAPARRVVGAAAVVVFLVGAVGVLRWRHGRPTTADAVRLAVLPFENVGDSARGYFADGMTDEVRGKLASLAGLQVIASTSSNQYRHTTKHPEEIGRELGVRYLLLGRVRWTQSARGVSRVRVDPELMQVADVAAPITRWEQSFDAPLTDVFEMQTNIAGKVAHELQLTLTPAAQQALAQRPTASLAAYDAFLKGEAASQGSNVIALPSLRQAIGYYGQAVTLDSAFALAWARLGQSRAFAYEGWGNLPTDARAARVAAERAQALAPGSPDVQLTLGIYQVEVRNDFLRALEAYRVGLERAPANADLLSSAAVAEVGLGRFDAALAHLDQALNFDPRSVRGMRVRAGTRLMLRRWGEARADADRALALAPGNITLAQTKVMTFVGEGDLAGARGVLRALPKDTDPTAVAVFMALDGDLYWVLDDAQQRLLLSLSPAPFGDDRSAWGSVLAQVYALRGDQTRARTYADSARIAIEARLRAAPSNAGQHVMLGLALALMGRRPDAIREAEHGVALLPVGKDAYDGPYLHHQLARIYVLAGEPEKALDELERLLKIPYYLSPGWLRIDPNFAPLRGNPRFDRLVAGH